MAVQLRPYQERMVGDTRQSFRDGHKATLLQLPTGGGKTITSGYIIGSAAQKQNRGVFICNRVELLHQTAKTFDALGIRYGLIAPGVRFNAHATVHIASIDTIKSRFEALKPYLALLKLAVWDECRSCGSAGWAKVFNYLAEQGVTQIGLDATPVRLDGKPLAEFFSHLVHGPSYSELVELGALVPFDCYAPSMPDLTGVRTKGYDFDKDAAEEAMDKPSITGDIVRNYVEKARGQKALVFAVSVQHSEHLAAEFCAAGVRAMHLDGTTESGIRARAIAAYKRGELEVITNVDLFTAGFDVPGIRVLIMARPTQSLSVFLQQAGRASRPDPADPTKTCAVLFDHAGNVFRHGLPDEDRTWTLEGKPKGPKKKKDDEDDVKVRQCPECFHAHKPAPVCPHCGHVYELTPREIERRDGELKKITKEQAEALRKARAKELKQAKTRPDLERIAAERGYSDAWVDAQLKFKERARERWRGNQAEAQFEAYMGWKR